MSLVTEASERLFRRSSLSVTPQPDPRQLQYRHDTQVADTVLRRFNRCRALGLVSRRLGVGHRLRLCPRAWQAARIARHHGHHWAAGRDGLRCGCAASDGPLLEACGFVGQRRMADAAARDVGGRTPPWSRASPVFLIGSGKLPHPFFYRRRLRPLLNQVIYTPVQIYTHVHAPVAL